MTGLSKEPRIGDMSQKPKSKSRRKINGESAVRQWKLEKGWTYREAAEELGINEGYCRRMGCGEVRPSVELALELEVASGGELDFRELLLGVE